MSNASLPLRVLHVVGRMNRGGAETLIMNIYRNIDREKIQFDFAVNTFEKSHFDDEIVSLGGRIFGHPAPSEVGIKEYSKFFTSTLSEGGPFNAVHSHVHLFSGVILKLAAQNFVPVRIAHSHSPIMFNSKSFKRLFYYWLMRRNILNYSTNLYGCSTDAINALFGLRAIKNKNAKIFYNAVDINDFISQSSRAKTIREILSLEENVPIVGHVGRFNQQKNHSFLIHIFNKLLKTLPSAQLVLIGDGPLKNDAEALVSALGILNNVHFLGVRDDVPALMLGMDVFLFPSLYEGLPVVLVEAQAAGLACVASDSITREADLHSGLVTFVGLLESEQNWVKEVIKGISIPKKSIKENHRFLVKAGFDLVEIVNKIEKVYSFAG